jgi:N-glycosylase/DNA lyase
MPVSLAQHFFAVRDYDLAATLASGQAFRWEERAGAWTGVVAGRWVRLRQAPTGIAAQTIAGTSDWAGLGHYLQIDTDLQCILASFPDDAPLRAAVTACRGLRLLRQDPWECLASFILSSTKQIVQIRQIVDRLCRRHGAPLVVPADGAPAQAFPSAAQLAGLTEAELRLCGMGFRAPYLLATARRVAAGQVDLHALPDLPLAAARSQLLSLPGVGPKIADCVLLFAGGQPAAFPVDVWVMKALRQLYFPRRRPTLGRMRTFAGTYFGPNAGYAQQYLFHYMRTQLARGPGAKS